MTPRGGCHGSELSVTPEISRTVVCAESLSQGPPRNLRDQAEDENDHASATDSDVGTLWNDSKPHLYRDAGLAMRIRQRRRIHWNGAVRSAGAVKPNQRWSMDFVSDGASNGASNGKAIRIFTT